MGLRFISGDREQQFLLAPDMRDWLPAEHVVWFLIEVVDQLDLDEFRRASTNSPAPTSPTSATTVATGCSP